MDNFAVDFLDFGEMWAVVKWDWMAGDFIDYYEYLDEETQEVESIPVYEGDFTIDRYYGFDVLTAKGSKSYESNQMVCVRKLIPIESLKKRYQLIEDQEKLKAIEEIDSTYEVFDPHEGKKVKIENHTTLREFYHRPCPEYPLGKFWFALENVILEEGDLPFGKWPVVYKGYKRIPKSARHKSWISDVKGQQVEINRIASKVAEHQIVLGDDKVFLHAGTRLSKRSTKLGMPEYEYIGREPKIIPGRTGQQYLESINQNISEMYTIAGEPEGNNKGSTDLVARLYENMRQKTDKVLYVGKFEDFFVDLYTLLIDLSKFYYEENRLASIVGTQEAVNIPEFLNSVKTRYQVKLEPQGEDVDTVMGQFIASQNILQYAGQNLSKLQLGLVIQNMPMANQENLINSLTYTNRLSQNIMLAMERGEYPAISKYEPFEELLPILTLRTTEADFKRLDPYVQQLYFLRIQQYESMLAEQVDSLSRANAGAIPSDGPLLAVDGYSVADPENPNKTRRVKLPRATIDWVVRTLEEQGIAQQRLQELPQAMQLDIQQLINPDSPIDVPGELLR